MEPPQPVGDIRQLGGESSGVAQSLYRYAPPSTHRSIPSLETIAPLSLQKLVSMHSPELQAHRDAKTGLPAQQHANRAMRAQHIDTQDHPHTAGH